MTHFLPFEYDMYNSKLAQKRSLFLLMRLIRLGFSKMKENAHWWLLVIDWLKELFMSHFCYSYCLTVSSCQYGLLSLNLFFFRSWFQKYLSANRGLEVRNGLILLKIFQTHCIFSKRRWWSYYRLCISSQ